jgi:DNA-binding beta-propeller fold protein YncE
MWSCLILILALPGALAGQHIQEAPLSAIRGDRCDVDVTDRITVLDTERSLVRLFRSDGTELRSVGGQGWDNDQFDSPRGIWARNSVDVFVADYGNHRIQRFDRSLNFVSSFSTRESSNPDVRFGYPTDVALSRLGDLFICDSENSRILKVSRLSKVDRYFGGFDAGKGRLITPSRIALGPRDHVYVLDGFRIAVFDNFGNYLDDLGTGQLREPIALDGDQDVVVVVDSVGLWFFGMNDRSLARIPLDELQIGFSSVRDVAVSPGRVFLMTDQGMHVLDSPSLDK